MTTTGCEEESLFSIWKFTRGEMVYSDGSTIPYAISYFNWLFYWFYGGLAKGCMSLFQLSDTWLPVITRGITFGIILGCIAVTYRILRETELWPARWGRMVCLSLVSLAFFSDLFRQWIATTRPDLGALLCELLGLWCALRYFRGNGYRPLLACVLWCYTAWAFKHNFVSVIVGVCLVLVLKGRRREFLGVVGVSLFLYALTFGIGSANYRFSIFSPTKYSVFSIEQGLGVIQRSVDAGPHLYVLAVALLATLFFRKQINWDASRLMIFFYMRCFLGPDANRRHETRCGYQLLLCALHLCLVMARGAS